MADSYEATGGHFAADWKALQDGGIVAYGRSLPRNCWLGVSVEDQKRADERIADPVANPSEGAVSERGADVGAGRLQPVL